MIVIPTPCESCGGYTEPTDVACDKCGKTQTIADFIGIIVHFSDMQDDNNEDECMGNCEHCEDGSLMQVHEFHFCDIGCLSEYITDPNDTGFASFEDKGVALYCDDKNASLLFYSLGRGTWDE